MNDELKGMTYFKVCHSKREPENTFSHNSQSPTVIETQVRQVSTVLTYTV